MYALRNVISDSKALDRQINKLVADITGLDVEKSTDKGTYPLPDLQLVYDIIMYFRS